MTWTILWKFRKDIGYALAILALILGFLYYRHSFIAEGENRIISQNKALVEQRNVEIAAQKAKDEKVLRNAEDAHQREIQLIRDASSVPLSPISLCIEASPGALSAASGVSTDRSSSTGVVPSDPGMYSKGPDISASLEMLIERADRLSADARQLNNSVHPQ